MIVDVDSWCSFAYIDDVLIFLSRCDNMYI